MAEAVVTNYDEVQVPRKVRTLFPVKRFEAHRSIYEVTLTGRAVYVFWSLSGDVNEMHDPRKGQGLVPGVALVTIVGSIISSHCSDREARGLNCSFEAPCYIGWEETRTLLVTLTYQSEECEFSPERTIMVEVHGLMRRTAKQMMLLVKGSAQVYLRKRKRN